MLILINKIVNSRTSTIVRCDADSEHYQCVSQSISPSGSVTCSWINPSPDRYPENMENIIIILKMHSLMSDEVVRFIKFDNLLT